MGKCMIAWMHGCMKRFPHFQQRVDLYRERFPGNHHIVGGTVFLMSIVNCQLNREIARQMLLDNFPIEKVIKYNGLTEKEINALCIDELMYRRNVF